MLEMRKGGRDEESSVLLVGGGEVDWGLCGRPGAWPGVAWAAVVEVGVGGRGGGGCGRGWPQGQEGGADGDHAWGRNGGWI